MLAKKYRLPIGSVLGKRGQNYKGHYFLLKVFPNTEKFNRFGVVVSKKVSKKAVERNYLKRIFFVSLRKFLGLREDGKDFLFVASPKAQGISRESLIKELESFSDVLK